MSWLERYRAFIIVLLIAVILSGVVLFLYRLTSLPHSEEIAILPPSSEICVDIEGEVVNPGAYMLLTGDHVADAVEVAGGFTAEADRGSVNLAATLREGEQVHICKLGESPQKININTAEAWLLESLPGIGEILAQRIIDYRTAHGYFQSIEDLKNVPDIGATVFDKVKDKITVH